MNVEREVDEEKGVEWKTYDHENNWQYTSNIFRAVYAIKIKDVK